jgi:hypothetical protein
MTASTASTTSAGTNTAPNAAAAAMPPSTPRIGPIQQAAQPSAATPTGSNRRRRRLVGVTAPPGQRIRQRSHQFDRHRAGGLRGDAAASWPALPSRSGTAELFVHNRQMCCKRGQFGDALLGLRDPFRDEWAQFRSDMDALAVLPHPEKFADLLQRQTQQLGRADEFQPAHRLLVIDPVTRGGACGRQ